MPGTMAEEGRVGREIEEDGAGRGREGGEREGRGWNEEGKREGEAQEDK